MKPTAAPGPRRRALIAAAAAAPLAGCARGRPPAPVFAYVALDGVRRTSDALRGRVVLVEFWATSCAICVARMPELTAADARYRPQGLETLAVSIREDAPANVARFAETRQLRFPVVIDNTGSIAAAFGGVEATPTLVLIDRRARIAARWIGPPPKPDLQAAIEQELVAPA